jgi:hypothetical protein
MTVKTALRLLLGVAAAAACSIASATATITIVNANDPGVGFNDPTPVAPVGGNAGTTLGQQRLNVFAYVAGLWGQQIDSAVTIGILSTFEPLTCTASSAVLGSAGPREIFTDFSGAPLAGTWYHAALADKLAGVDLDPTVVPIRARFNVNLGQPNCLAGSPFYLGLDSNVPAGQINLVVVLLHEFAHGLGFSTVTDGSTGAYLLGLPSAWDHLLFDDTQGLTWVQMTDAQRAASAINVRKLVWAGANVTAAVPTVLAPGTPKLTVIEPLSIAGDYLVGTASFGPSFNTIDLTRQVMPIVEAGNLGLACNPFDATNQRFAKNRIAIVLRGTCTFVTKVKNAQNAGAVGVIVIDNVPGSPPAGLGGSDPTITIPAVRVSLADGITLLNGMNFNIPSGRSVNEKVHLYNDFSQYAGADATGHALLYTPNPFQPGSSVSHWDTSAFPNQLMEPAINTDLTTSVKPPQDLTLPLLQDIGW